MRIYLTVLFSLSLQACATVGNTCIQDGLFVGDTLTNTATKRKGVVERIHGPSHRCPDPKFPKAADVKYE